MYTYICIHIYIYIYVHIYINTYIYLFMIIHIKFMDKFMHEATAILKAKEDVHGSWKNVGYIGLEVTRDIPQM